MTKKSNYLLSLFGALLLTSPLQAQSLLPKPQQVTMGKGVFNTSDGVKVENQVGADAENIYTKAWNVKVNDAAKRVVKFTPLANASSPEAYRLHVAPDAIEISAASSEGFLRAWQTMEQLTTKKGIACCDIVDAPGTQPVANGGFIPTEKVYSYVPGSDLPEAERNMITGVQANLWTEHIPTPEYAEYMLYPRALALAEIGWNGTKTKNYPEFKTRALAQVEHLKAEGVNPFNLKKEIGERKEKMKPVQHKAVGAKVTYNHAYNRYYPAAGEKTLVDGNMGGWAHGDGRWQGFIGKNCFDVTIDLGKSTKISSVGTDFMQSSGPEIFYPSQYTVSVSEDGKNFTQVFDKKYESSKEPILNFKTLTWKGSKTARYIRVQAKPSSFGGWLFVDEIIVK